MKGSGCFGSCQSLFAIEHRLNQLTEKFKLKATCCFEVYLADLPMKHRRNQEYDNATEPIVNFKHINAD